MNLEEILGKLIFPNGQTFDFGKYSFYEEKDENFHDPAFKQLLDQEDFQNILEEYNIDLTNDIIHMQIDTFINNNVLCILNLSYLDDFGKKNKMFYLYLPDLINKKQLDYLNDIKDYLGQIGKVKGVTANSMFKNLNEMYKYIYSSYFNHFKLSKKFVLSCDEFEIYEENDIDNSKKYYLIEPNTKEIIGTIYIDYSADIKDYGNIGYYINKDFQGHNFTVKALELLMPYLYDNGLETGYICFRTYNEASKHIAQKLGFLPIKEDNEMMGINVYKLDVIKKLESKGKRI